MRGGAARWRAHEAAVAAGAGRGNLGRLDLRGKAQPIGVHTKQLSRQGWGAGHPPSASAASTFRTFAAGPTAIALRLSSTLKYTGMGSMGLAQHGSFNWEKPGLYFFLNVPCMHMQPFARRALGRMLRRCTASTPVSSLFEWNNFVDRSSRSTGARQHAETLHGIDPGLIIVFKWRNFVGRSALFTNSFSSTPRHRVGKAKT